MEKEESKWLFGGGYHNLIPELKQPSL